MFLDDWELLPPQEKEARRKAGERPVQGAFLMGDGSQDVLFGEGDVCPS